ncbi:hypothetical protein MMYC01_200544 [Madurella mycetomatis]|uniref:Uncharacterized protein n=1 Tax=Madurella mycetomatis TaxID=100816 RepID=A0A175WH57_9PEZI|nr:hypothetical protein MMYC01_200544 [Madurella mycetomatis]
MAGLIPLMLASGNRASVVTQSQPPSRRQSTTTTSPTRTEAPRLKLPKRMSLPAAAAAPTPAPAPAPGPTPAPLTILPYTRAEWKKAISEVKRQYFSKRYRACSARCLEILDAVRDTSHADPVYLIYLNFYAATSMEICARPLPSTAALRTSLLQQARTHFDRAASLISAAEDSVIRRFRPYSATSSRGSSCHSPSGSISSRAWTPDTRVSSPTDSVCSFEDLSSNCQSPAKRVKKVSFSLPKEETFQIQEPIIRPDSPTLGFDDVYFQAGVMRQDLPDLPVAPKFHEIEFPLPTIPEAETDSALPPPPEEDSEHSFLVARSVDRCCEHLSGLRAQLKRHSQSLEGLLAISASAQQQQQQQQQKQQKTKPATSTKASNAETFRALDRQARIERLRKCGWQRKRFDSSRYEELCETVMAELNGA